MSRYIAFTFSASTNDGWRNSDCFRRGLCSAALTSWKIFSRLCGALLLVTISFCALYFALASPPMHFIYDVVPPAGPSSVYIPGGGFPGFWFHLGFLQSMTNLNDYDYYCYSSGCLGVLAAFMNTTLDEAIYSGFAVQDAWNTGSLNRFELVDKFFDDIVPSNSTVSLEDFLPRLKILVTTLGEGVRITQATDRDELKDLIVKTTWVPYVTGWGILADDEETYFDGGFSRLIHPECNHRLDLPLNKDTLLDVFNPALSRDAVHRLWRIGQDFDHPLAQSNNIEIDILRENATSFAGTDDIH